MIPYHKINSVFKRDPETNYKTFLNEYSQEEFRYLAMNDWIGTEKVDGMNIRISAEGFAGKSDEANLPGDLIPYLKDISLNMLSKEMFGVTLYGEGYGAGIQKGTNYRADKSFVLFDVHGPTGFYPYEHHDSRVPTVLAFSEALDVTIVPILEIQPLLEWVVDIQEGKYSESELHLGAINEGVVLRPLVELNNFAGDRIITKLKYKDFANVSTKKS